MTDGSSLLILFLAIIAVLYLITGLTLGAYLSIKMGYKKLNQCEDILNDFSIKWPLIIGIGIKIYFKERKERQAIEDSFKPLKVFVCIPK